MKGVVLVCLAAVLVLALMPGADAADTFDCECEQRVLGDNYWKTPVCARTGFGWIKLNTFGGSEFKADNFCKKTGSGSAECYQTTSAHYFNTYHLYDDGECDHLYCTGCSYLETVTCTADWEATETTCDGIDNDCDGEVDEGNLCGGELVCRKGSCQEYDIECDCNVQPPICYIPHPYPVNGLHDGDNAELCQFCNKDRGSSAMCYTTKVIQDIGTVVLNDDGSYFCGEYCGWGDVWIESVTCAGDPKYTGEEICYDGLDNNCDGQIDENCPCEVVVDAKSGGKQSFGNIPAGNYGIEWIGGAWTVSESTWGSQVHFAPDCREGSSNGLRGLAYIYYQGGLARTYCWPDWSGFPTAQEASDYYSGQMVAFTHSGGEITIGMQDPGALRDNWGHIAFVLHGGSCDTVCGEDNAEVCDGVDNDCDGQVDEGCCNADWQPNTYVIVSTSSCTGCPADMDGTYTFAGVEEEPFRHFRWENDNGYHVKLYDSWKGSIHAGDVDMVGSAPPDGEIECVDGVFDEDGQVIVRGSGAWGSGSALIKFTKCNKQDQWDGSLKSMSYNNRCTFINYDGAWNFNCEGTPASIAEENGELVAYLTTDEGTQEQYSGSLGCNANGFFVGDVMFSIEEEVLKLIFPWDDGPCTDLREPTWCLYGYDRCNAETATNFQPPYCWKLMGETGLTCWDELPSPPCKWENCGPCYTGPPLPDFPSPCTPGATHSYGTDIGECTIGTAVCNVDGVWEPNAEPNGPFPEWCADGLDNDCDGLTDCEDDDCSGDPACLTGTCGNGVIDAVGEECDVNDWGTVTGCSDLDAFTGGSLTCGADCLFDASQCHKCSNKVIDAGEDCDDGNMLDGDGCSSTCQTEQFCTPIVYDTGWLCMEDGFVPATDLSSYVISLAGDAYHYEGTDSGDPPSICGIMAHYTIDSDPGENTGVMVLQTPSLPGIGQYVFSFKYERGNAGESTEDFSVECGGRTYTFPDLTGDPPEEWKEKSILCNFNSGQNQLTFKSLDDGSVHFEEFRVYSCDSSCGDGIRQDINNQGQIEQCDGADDAQCPGQCEQNCNCPDIDPACALLSAESPIKVGDSSLVEGAYIDFTPVNYEVKCPDDSSGAVTLKAGSRANLLCGPYGSEGSYTISDLVLIDGGGARVDCVGLASVAVTEGPGPHGGPQVSVTGAPPAWTSTPATAQVTCTDPTHGCDPSTYRLKAYSTNPGGCPQDHLQYSLTSPATVSSHSWLCGAAKNTAGEEGFSDPVEFKVDMIPPVIAGITDDPDPLKPGMNIEFRATITDQLSGVKNAVVCPTTDPDCGYNSPGYDPATGKGRFCRMGRIGQDLWSCQHNTILMEPDTYNYKIIASDQAGNEAESDGTDTFTVEEDIWCKGVHTTEAECNSDPLCHWCSADSECMVVEAVFICQADSECGTVDDYCVTDGWWDYGGDGAFGTAGKDCFHCVRCDDPEATKWGQNSEWRTQCATMTMEMLARVTIRIIQTGITTIGTFGIG